MELLTPVRQLLSWGLILLLFILSSCDPLKRIQRIADRNPHVKVADTLLISDTIQIEIPGTYKDTIVTIESARKDTIVIRDSNMTIRTYIHKDSIFISGECDTIHYVEIREIEVPIEPFVYRRPRDNLLWYHYLLYFGSIIGIIIIKKRR